MTPTYLALILAQEAFRVAEETAIAQGLTDMDFILAVRDASQSLDDARREHIGLARR